MSDSIVLVTQAQFDRIWDALPPDQRREAPADHPLTRAGYVALWWEMAQAWIRVSPYALEAVLAIEGAQRAEFRLMEQFLSIRGAEKVAEQIRCAGQYLHVSDLLAAVRAYEMEP